MNIAKLLFSGIGRHVALFGSTTHGDIGYITRLAHLEWWWTFKFGSDPSRPHTSIVFIVHP